CLFVQAEDGIRDDLVTGVQTCALPIFTCLTVLDELPDIRVVLLDLSVGGTELLRLIKVKRPAVDVIMMTEQGEEGLAKRSISLEIGRGSGREGECERWHGA